MKQVFAVFCVLGFMAFGGLCRGRAADVFPGMREKWQRYQSPNFEMFSMNDDEASRTVLHDLETFRALFLETYKLKERQPLLISVYFFDDGPAFKKYVNPSLGGEIAGYYQRWPDRAVIVLSAEHGWEASRQIIFHEYIHHLLHAAGQEPPMWYDEGMAELMGTVDFEKDFSVIGRHIPNHTQVMATMRMLPLETLFAMNHQSGLYNESTRAGIFYAESWTLLHYLLLGDSKISQDKIRLFLESEQSEKAQRSPGERKAFFEATLGVTYEQMEWLLSAYARGGRYRGKKIKTPQVDPASSYSRAPLPAGLARMRLAELMLRSTDSPKARLELMGDSEMAGASPRLFEVLGSDALIQNEERLATERWQKAIALGSTNPAVYYELGAIECGRWFEHFDYDLQLPDETAERLRTLLLRSISAAPYQSEAYEWLAMLESFSEHPSIQNINAVQQVFPGLKHKDRVLIAFAVVRIRMGDRATAGQILDALDRRSPDEPTRRIAAVIRRHLAEKTASQNDGESPEQK